MSSNGLKNIFENPILLIIALLIAVVIYFVKKGVGNSK